MSLQINLRHLEDRDLELTGEVSAAQLELNEIDEVVHVTQPLKYDLKVQKIGTQLLVEGHLEMNLECECVRCLKRFPYEVNLTQWASYLPLEGEEKIVVSNDCIDLTPCIREDMLLEFPQHPLCKIDCAGLPNRSDEIANKPEGSSQTQNASAWSELNKLKF
jgi:uncharacterized protein